MEELTFCTSSTAVADLPRSSSTSTASAQSTKDLSNGPADSTAAVSLLKASLSSCSPMTWRFAEFASGCSLLHSRSVGLASAAACGHNSAQTELDVADEVGNGLLSVFGSVLQHSALGRAAGAGTYRGTIRQQSRTARFSQSVLLSMFNCLNE